MHEPTWVYGNGMSNGVREHIQIGRKVYVDLNEIFIRASMKLGFPASIPYYTNLGFACDYIVFNTSSQGSK
jgi:hypothetical protein